MASLMHGWLYVKSYEVFTEEMDVDEGESGVEGGGMVGRMGCLNYRSHTFQRAHTSYLAFFRPCGFEPDAFFLCR